MELIVNIEAEPHEKIAFDIDEELCNNQDKMGNNGEVILMLISHTLQKIHRFTQYGSNLGKEY